MENEGQSKINKEQLRGDDEYLQDAIGYLKNTESTEKEKDESNLWEFLCSLVDKLLSERPNKKNALDTMENIVLSLKKEKDMERQETSHAVLNLASNLEHARILKNLLTPDPIDEEWMIKEVQPSVSPWSDVTDQMTLLKRVAGVFMPDNVVLQLSLSIRRLLQSNPDIYRARFWGSISEVYFVVETELSESGYIRRREEQEKQRLQLLAKLEAEQSSQEDDTKGDVDTTSQQPPSVPAEPSGSGVNRMVYFVSREPAGPDSWYLLPDVTPQQITAARQIASLFSGDLRAPVNSWPPFPGNEAALLRAQVTRISAATHVAPVGFFKMRRKRSPSEQLEEESDEEEEDEEEEDEEEPVEREVVVNTRYQPATPSSLLHLSAWLHYTPHILQQQARTVWWNPQPPGEQDEEEDEESGSEASGDRGPRAEAGPRPFAVLSEDRSEPELVPGIPACFALRSASCRVPAVIARSLLWPGALTLVLGRRLEHVYLGCGVKSGSRHRAPLPTPLPAVEPSDLSFKTDPSPAEEEEAARRDTPEEDEDEEEGSDE